MDYFSFVKEIEKNRIHPLYLLYGKEDFLIKDSVDKIVSTLLTEEEKDFNYSIYDMKEVPIQVAVEEGETLPFFGERRVIFLKNCYFLTTVKEKEKVEHDLSTFEKYIQSPAEETVMIVSVGHEKLDERKKIVKQLKKNGVFLEANAFQEKELRQWIDNFEREISLQLEEKAKNKLVQLTGRNMMTLTSELNKLSLYGEEGGVITEADIEELVPRTLEDNIFELVDSVVRGKAERAMDIFYDLIKQKEEPIKIVALLARQFRIILQASYLHKKGYTQKQIASQIKVHPYAVKMALAQGKRFDERQLTNILQTLATVDYDMKTGKMEKQLRLELCLLELLHE
ncbi:DNA polymerase III subunit delta [Aliibacillus thermotolerans]|uniref:DNA polymerase III subunit delta n=1 Tax=Aliibacillus thermotolerans TaxID=1834418 RepID=A0ABW0U8F6_9BACI|nr:DNA polymerase III subunit delta [Aliibacillus thermotolerans]MDA3130761.1 DNA polymerase III subunit delta [Aliibacillus thermotolerans]